MKKLKSPDLKVPQVFHDLYQDLRDRRLLPLVALLLIAIVAAPFLLSDSKEEVAPAPVSRASQPGTEQASMAVVRAAPGLRKPKRLRHREPEDPFKQQYVSPPLSEEPVTVQSSGATTNEESEVDSSPGGTTVTTVRSGVIFYATAATVKIVRSETTLAGEAVHQEPIIRQRILPSTTLLGEKAQIVTYMGPSSKTRNPTFLISEDVTAVFGEGNCLAGVERCQLIELKENEPEVFVYGANDIRYRITVLGTEIIETGRAERP